METKIEWFGDTWEGKVITFPGNDGQPATSWKLGHKLANNKFKIIPESERAENSGPNVAWVPFSCTEAGTTGPEYVMKVYMQIPNEGTMADSIESRRRQSREDLPRYARDELAALQLLTRGRCKSTPLLISHLQDKQGDDMWVPGGFVLYILMTKCPGTALEHSGFHTLPPETREDIRKSFKIAYTDCLRCGVDKDDVGHDNLLWDDAAKTCYVVDFRDWVPVRPGGGWDDEMFDWWNLEEMEF